MKFITPVCTAWLSLVLAVSVLARLGDTPLEAGETMARRHETVLRLPLGRVAAPFTVDVTLA